MCKYNYIVSVYKKIGGEEIPATKFTMFTEKETDIYIEVVKWVTDNLGWDNLDKILFNFDKVEVNTGEWMGKQ